MSDVREAVRERYAAAALRMGERETASCCGEGDASVACCGSYGSADLADVRMSAGSSLGCSNPTLLAELRPGEVVLDLGSGAGLDVLLSARRVAPGGRAYGVDMTDEMLGLARQNQTRAGIENATFQKGTIDSVPLPDAAVDVVISNCVINLTEDKGAVIREAFRLLRPGGRLAVADMVELERLPDAVKQRLEAWADCIAGTIPVGDYRKLLLDAGFDDIDIEVTGSQDVGEVRGAIGSAQVRAVKPAGTLRA